MNQCDKNYSTDNILAFIKNKKAQFVYSVIIYIAIFMVSLLFSKQVIEALQGQVPFEISFIQTSPIEMLVNLFKISSLISLFFSLPLILYLFTKSYIKNLTKQQKLIYKKIIISSYLTTIAGTLLAYFAFIPFQLFFLLGLNLDVAEITLNISSFISFCLSSIIISCLIFHMPLIYYFSKKKQFFSYKAIYSLRKYIFWSSLTIALLIFAPTYIISIIVLTIVMTGLYKIILFLTKDLGC